MRRILLAAIFSLSPVFAEAQTQNVVTAIPGKGLYVPSPTLGGPGTFIPGGQILSMGRVTGGVGDAKDFCATCGCCIEINMSTLVDNLKKSGQGTLASDSTALSGAISVDLSKLPKK